MDQVDKKKWKCDFKNSGQKKKKKNSGQNLSWRTSAESFFWLSFIYLEWVCQLIKVRLRSWSLISIFTCMHTENYKRDGIGG